MTQNRQLAAILFTDIVGYTAMMQHDEQYAVSIMRHYNTVLKQQIEKHHGKILNDYGDGNLCSFSSATEAITCSIEIQQQLQQGPKVPLRIGLHIGELLFEGDKVMGDGVNVASRVQSLGQPNCILFSSEINNKLKNQQGFKSVSLGHFLFKNVDESVEIFALTNDGFVVPDRKNMEGKLQKAKSSKKSILLSLSLLLLALISFFVYRQFYGSAGFSGKDKSIAVLPLESVSPAKETEYINDGFTIDLIDKLSKLSGLSGVPGWTRVKSLKGSSKTLKDIANELGVEAILSWTIQKQADKIRIATELTDVNSGQKIWSEEFDSKLVDILTLQTEVAQKIVKSLSARITPQEKIEIRKHYTDNAEAWRFYNKGRYFWDNRTPVSFDSAEANYNKAKELDPNYALAYAGLADLFIFNQKGFTQKEAVPFARDYANKALALDSTLVPAITTLGFIQSAFDYDWEKSRQTLEHAIKLDSNYTYAHIYYCNLLLQTHTGVERAIEQIKIARSLDPLSASINWVLGRTYYSAKKYDLAEEQLKKMLRLNPKAELPRMTLAWVLLMQKKYPEALELIRQIPKSGIAKSEEYQGTLLSFAYAAMGDSVKAKKELAATLAGNHEVGPYFLARVYLALKDYNKAMDLFEQAYDIRDIMMYGINNDPSLDPIRNEPRFKELIKKMNL